MTKLLSGFYEFSKMTCHLNCVAHNTAESCSKTLANTHLYFNWSRCSRQLVIMNVSIRSKHLHLFYTANNSTSHTHEQPNQPADLIQTICLLHSFSNIPVSLSLSPGLRNSPSNKLQMSSVSMDTGETVCVTQDRTHPRKQLHFCNQMRCVCDIILLDIFTVQNESDSSVAS